MPGKSYQAFNDISSWSVRHVQHDKNNVYKAIEILKEYATLYNMTIFVVSHEALPEEFFNSKIFVKTQDHFSEMEISKVGHSK